MIEIFTFVSKPVEFIGLQLDSLRKHLREPFGYTVFNNAGLDNSGCGADAVNQECQQLKIRVIEITKDKNLIDRCQRQEKSCSLFNERDLYSNGNVAHAYALCWAWEKVISKNPGVIAILDSDVFLIEPTNLSDLLGDHQLYCTHDGRPHLLQAMTYIWPPVVLIDIPRLLDPETLNWWCGQINGVSVDVGGQTHHYLQAHPELDVAWVEQTHVPDNDIVQFHPANYDEFKLDGTTLLHYRCGTNWNKKSAEYHELKRAWLKERIG